MVTLDFFGLDICFVRPDDRAYNFFLHYYGINLRFGTLHTTDNCLIPLFDGFLCLYNLFVCNN